MFGVLCIQGRCIVGCWGILYGSAIGWFLPGMRGVLGMVGRTWVVKVLQNAFNVAWNGDVNSMIGIVPFDSEATIMSTSPILTHGIQLLQCLHEVLSIGFVGVFGDAEVIDNKSKDKIRVGVFPKSRCDRHRDVAMWGKEGGEAIVGNLSGMRILT